jgi:SAM-dependent methyltransferase
VSTSPIQPAVKKAILQWDVPSWNTALEFWNNHISWDKTDLCLELGSREGGLSLWCALHGKKTTCSDLGDVRKTAEPLHRQYGVTDLISYESINATEIPYENHFDLILVKSIIGGIGSNDRIELQQAVFDSIYNALKPGGKLVFAENLAASPLHRIMRRRFTNWGASWRYITLPETEQFLKRFHKKEIRVTGFAATFGRNEKQRNGLHFFDRFLFNFITPRSWKYIVYGVAEK